MNSVFTILVVTFLQFVAGFGLLSFARISLKPAMQLALALLLGVVAFSIVPFLLELLFIPLTKANVFIALLISCLLTNIKYKTVWTGLKNLIKNAHFRTRLYELPALLVIAFIVIISVWRCFYFPPTSRDFTSGPEVIAEYAIKEKTMVNSVFSVNLETTNNQFKSPFLISLQIIYKYAGFPFGQLWLSTVFISFIVFLYHALVQFIHRLLAGLLIVAFLAIPEMYAYTFMGLYDYSNAVFFFLACWFMIEFFRSGGRKHIAFAGLLMGIATYIRSETLVLGGMLIPAILWYDMRKKNGLRGMISSVIYFLLPSVIFYFLTVYVYINFYLPVQYDIDGLVNKDLLNLQPLITRFFDINRVLIFSERGIIHFGYFIFIFVAFLISDLFAGNVNRMQRNWLYTVMVVYIGLAILGFILPLVDLDNSTKRGLFKAFPLMLLYIGNSNLLINLSRRIEKWESGLRAVPPAPH